MKYTIFLVLVLVFSFSVLGIYIPDEVGEDKTTTQNDMVQLTSAVKTENKTMNKEELKINTQNVEKEMEQMRIRLDKESENLSTKQKEMVQNQNQVRLAVHAFLAMENATGIGPKVSQIAKEFNNSINKQYQKEETIQNRNVFARMFAGGDHEAAKEMLKEVNSTQTRIREMKQLINDCSECDEATKLMMHEQLTNLEQEQTRLGELATKEQTKKGLFGWMWK